MNNNEKQKKLAKEQTTWYKGAKGRGIIPDSLELEIAYWESFRSEWPMEQYRAGAPIGEIARAHGRTSRSLTKFFEQRYGKRWREKPKPEKKSVTNARVIRNEQIVSLMAEGWRIKEIAHIFGVTYDTVAYRIVKHNLREIANAKRTPAAA